VRECVALLCRVTMPDAQREVGDGLWPHAPTLVDDAAVGVGGRTLWSNLDGLGVVGDGLFPLIQPRVREPTVEPPAQLLVVAPDCFAEVLDRAAVLLLLQHGQTQPRAGHRVVGRAW
jgi:hypothetical protein